MKKLLLFLVTLIFCFLSTEIQAQCPVKAGFNYSINNGYKVVFSSSQTPQSHYWTFGHKNGQGNTYNPTYTYPGPGTYTVCHYVYSYDSSTRKKCADTVCRKITIPPGCSANASFATSIKCDSVKFIISKQNSNRVLWGDGSSTPNAFNTWHKYQKAGTYTICHIASGYDSSTRKYCQDTVCKNVTVTKCGACNLDASFTEIHSGGGRHYFTPKTKIGKHKWYFGDGNSSSSTYPIHTYSRTGSYTVCHLITYYDSAYSKWCSDSICRTITYKNSGCNANASFTATKFQNSTLKYQLKPTQTNGKHYWYVSDGNKNYNTTSPYHTFSKAGTYTICHDISYYDSIAKKWCSDSTCKTITVGSQCKADATFYQQVSGQNLYISSAQNSGIHKYTFGDGNSSTQAFPRHTYKKAGTYTICHSISNYDSITRKWCYDSTCKTITIKAACNADASFTYSVDNRNTVKFKSKMPYAKNHWNFSNGAGTSTLANPSYTFKKAGMYLVCHSVSYYDSTLRKWCSDSVCQYVNANACRANAFFNPSINGLTATFYDYKPNASHSYTFGDGNSSRKSNPTHTYKKTGTYTVCHFITEYDSITRTSCTDSTCKTIYVKSSGPCDASFQAYDSLNTMHFYSNNTSRSVKHAWTFGDGNYSSNKDPIHSYRKKGSYTVCHIVTKYDSSNNRIICQDSVCQKMTIGNTSIADDEIKSSLNIYPNPANHKLNIDFSISAREEMIIRILNPLGQVEFSKEIIGVNGANHISLPIINLQNGLYFIQIQSTQGQSTKSFIKQ